MLVDEILGLLQLRSRVIPIGMQDAVLHLGVINDEDNENTTLGERQEFDLAQGHLRCARHRNHTGHVRKLRQHTRDRAHKSARALVLTF